MDRVGRGRSSTIAAVAKREGVQRLTVYRHFEDEMAMLQACSSHWTMQNPPPLEEEWQQLENSKENFFTALLAINTYYSKTEGMLAKIYRDASEMESLAIIMKGFDDYFANIADNLALDLASGGPNEKLRAVARHLVRFSTWQSLSQEKLSSEDIAGVGLVWLEKLAR